jgi:6-phosphogluconolactonase
LIRRLRPSLCVVVLLALALAAGHTVSAQDNDFFTYFGTYTGFKYVRRSKTQLVGQSKSKGIYVSRFHPATGEISEPELAAEIVNPSFLAVNPNNRFLYAVTEDPLSLGPPLDHASYVSSFSIDSATGKLRLLNTLPTGGTSTCFLSLDKAGRYLFLANFGSGSISVLRVKDDGSLGEMTAFVQHLGHSVNPVIQTGPHPHSILVSPDNRYVIVSDLGLDKILVYHFDANTGQLSPLDPVFATVQPGGGPRHFTFVPSGKFAYQLSEMSGIVNVFAWDPTRGTLTPVQEVPTIPHDLLADNHSAEIQTDAKGAFLYESNRRTRNDNADWGPDTIGVFKIDPGNGTLTHVQDASSGGIMPRNFSIDPTGKYMFVLHQVSNDVVLFQIDPTAGKLTNTGKEIKVDTPVCIVFVPMHPSEGTANR